MATVAVIGGTSLFASKIFSHLKERIVQTEHGNVIVWVSDEERAPSLVFLQRHHADADLGKDVYRPPHLINHRANISALIKLGVKKCLGVASVGSLDPDIVPGTLVVPDDFCMLFAGPISLYDDSRSHIVPGFDVQWRKEIIQRLTAAGFSSPRLVTQATYVQTQGPRFETHAEIRFIKQMGQLVGMTAGAEITIAKDGQLPYASICMVDNFANGLVGVPLTEEEFRSNVLVNQKTVESALAALLEGKVNSGT